VGAVREFVRQLSPTNCEVFVTGGGPLGQALADLKPTYVPDLVLRGVAWAAHRLRQQVTTSATP
jgi:hypothetical protein